MKKNPTNNETIKTDTAKTYPQRERFPIGCDKGSPVTDEYLDSNF